MKSIDNWFTALFHNLTGKPIISVPKQKINPLIHPLPEKRFYHQYSFEFLLS